MNKQIAIALIAVGLMGTTVSFAQTEGPKAAKKEAKMEKKNTKMANDAKMGKTEKADKKQAKAVKKDDKMDKKASTMK